MDGPGEQGVKPRARPVRWHLKHHHQSSRNVTDVVSHDSAVRTRSLVAPRAATLPSPPDRDPRAPEHRAAVQGLDVYMECAITRLLKDGDRSNCRSGR